jgi:hypothetical protein
MCGNCSLGQERGNGGSPLVLEHLEDTELA